MNHRRNLSHWITLAALAAIAGSCSDPSGPSNPPPTPTAPGVPQNVTVVLTGARSARITWTPNSAADSVTTYSIYRDDAKAGDAASPPYDDTSLAEGVGYSYSVSATSKAGLVSAKSSVTSATSVTTPDVTAPTVTATTPLNGATGIAISSVVTATFSEAMSAATITTATFSLSETGGASVPGAVTYDAASRKATLTPSAALREGASYTATISPAAKDAAGNALASPYVFGFSTPAVSPPPPPTAPTVVSISPASGATGVGASAIVTVTFSKAMDATTINSSTFSLQLASSGAVVPSVISYDAASQAARITPSSSLQSSMSYNVVVSSTVKDTEGNALGAQFTFGFTTGDFVPPSVAAMTPAPGSSGITTTTGITATFSEAMDASSISASTFSLHVTSGGASVGGSVTYDAATRVATFTPSSALANGTSYTATISTGVHDTAGNALAAASTWSFTTATAVVALSVTSTSPQNGTTNVAVTSKISVTFNKAIDESTISSSTFVIAVTSPFDFVNGTRTYDAATRSISFTPSSGALGNGTNYTVRVTTGLHDATGLGLSSDLVFAFTAVPDLTPPAVTAVSPASGTAGVAITSTVAVTFSKSMNAATINSGTFTVKQGSSAVPGSISYNAGSRVATFTPSSPLGSGVAYAVNVSTGVTDINGVAMSAAFASTFSTMPSGPTGANINGYWTGTDDLGAVHWHVNFAASGTTVTLTPSCPGDECRVFPLDATGNAAVGTGIPVDVTELNGTFNDPAITFTLKIANGKTFTFTGNLTSTTSMTGTISGATLGSRTLTLNKAAVP